MGIQYPRYNLLGMSKDHQDHSNLPGILESLRSQPDFSDNITAWQCQPRRQALLVPFPSSLHPRVAQSLADNGIHALYSHQAEALDLLGLGKHVVVTTGTASGKSLCYQVSILDRYLSDGMSTALLLFPTKALTYDQLQNFKALLPPESRAELALAVYDGDTPQRERAAIREKSKILLTNPDMLSLGILPNHTRWAGFFSNLKYVVIDEIHIYRGVFGSHIANLIRRLKRICAFYGASPQFIMTSATIQNPAELGEKLIEQPVSLVEKDGSPHGEKNFIIYNPPLVNPELGIREGLMVTTQRFMQILQAYDIQSIIFCRTRKFVEILLRDSRLLFPAKAHRISGYRSGYLKDQRREIERGLKDGSILFAIATNALELGVDIGGVETVMIPGYPGSISALRQESGRAGRKENTSLSIFIASMNPLDQYLARNPEYLLARNPEQALINPDNSLILVEHLQCSAAELPFSESDSFGALQGGVLNEYLEYLESSGVLHKKNGKYYWVADDYPAQHVAIRNAVNSTILLQSQFNGEREVIGEVDFNSGLWMVHPGAIYIHNGDTYLVDSLDLENQIAALSPANVDYLTEAVQSAEIDVLLEKKSISTGLYDLKQGEILVRSQVKGFKRVKVNTREALDFTDLQMPETQLRTEGYWIVLSDACVERMRESGLWKSDVNDYGRDWEQIRSRVRQRDGYACQSCGVRESLTEHHVHHKIPFKQFASASKANALDNLVLLCANCHKLVESQVKVRSAISGLKYALQNLSPLLVMSDPTDLGSFIDPAAKFAANKPAILFYDSVPAGIGLAETLYGKFQELLLNSKKLIEDCECTDGCPSCVGPTLDPSTGGKKETLYLIDQLLKENLHGIVI